MIIYKILTDDQWTDLDQNGRTDGAPVDLADGFIHFSTGAQVAETAAKHFAGQAGLWLLAVDAAPLGAALKWEVSRGGQKFPHLYAPLAREMVLRADPLPLDAATGRHQFPDRLA